MPLFLQAAGPDALVFAIVRNKKGSTHLTTAAANLKNSHIVDADVVDHASQEVRQPVSPHAGSLVPD